MIRDFNNGDDGASIETDVCIVGSGAAGISLAREFIGTAWRVTVLEGGGRSSEAESQDIYQAEVIGLPHTGVHEGRMRVFGGSTTAWGGQALRLCPADFAAKPWVPWSGWPLSYDDLVGFYRRAEQVLGIKGEPYGDERWSLLDVQSPALDPETFHCRFSQWPPLRRRNFALSYEAHLQSSRNIAVMLHANVVNIATNDGATKVDHVEIKTFSGKSGKVKARVFVLCCGGIETARLLLASNRVEARGIGNRNDLVGRFFQDHLSLGAGRIVPEDRKYLQSVFNPSYANGVMHTCKIELNDRIRQRHEILNVLGHLIFEIPQGSGLREVKSVLAELQAGTISVARGAMRLARVRDRMDLLRLVVGKLFLKRRLSMRRGDIYLRVDSEQAPNPDSRVMLGGSRDALGMPRAVIDWRISELDIRTLTTFTHLIQQEWARLGLGRVIVPEETPSAESLRRGDMRDVFHHIGTTRMHDDPRKGVVDRDCKIHGVENLYVGSSSVFPTGGNSNPTLTIIALCLRLADHLKDALRHSLRR
jgi:choline dehydrogenase-like flavoprotein